MIVLAEIYMDVYWISMVWIIYEKSGNCIRWMLNADSFKFPFGIGYDSSEYVQMVSGSTAYNNSNYSCGENIKDFLIMRQASLACLF